MRSYSILSLLVTAALSSGAVASPHPGGHASFGGVRVGHHSLAKRVTHNEAHNAPASWNHEKRQMNGARLTWYHTGLGACGGYNGENDYIVALNEYQWDGGSHCGQQITINVNGKSTQATIVDLCPFDSCPFGALDLSPGLFKFWASNPAETGVLNGDWSFGGGGGGSKPEEPKKEDPPKEEPKKEEPKKEEPKKEEPKKEEPKKEEPKKEEPSTTQTPPPPPTTSATSTTETPSTTAEASSSSSSASSSSASATPSYASLQPATGKVDMDEFQAVVGNLAGLVYAGASAKN